MAEPEMSKAISRVRFLLATITGKEEDLEGLSRQFKRQLARVPGYAVHGGNSLEGTLAIMSEVQERLDEVETTHAHLAAIRVRAEEELQALDLTNRIEQAKNDLAALQARQNSGVSSNDLKTEIVELERFIEEASRRAGEAITARLAEPIQPAGS